MAISSSISRYYNQPVNKIGENVFYLEDEYVLDESPTDLTTYVRESEVNRIDLLSYRIYKNPLLAWVIVRRNKLENMDDLWLGREIKYPPLDSIYKEGGIIHN